MQVSMQQFQQIVYKYFNENGQKNRALIYSMIRF